MKFEKDNFIDKICFILFLSLFFTFTIFLIKASSLSESPVLFFSDLTSSCVV